MLHLEKEKEIGQTKSFPEEKDDRKDTNQWRRAGNGEVSMS